MLHETNIYYIFDNRPKQSNDNKAPRSYAQGPPILSVRAWVWHYAWSCAPAPTRFATCETATHKREEEGVKEREGKIKSGREAQAEDAALSRLAMHEFISRTCHNQFDSMRTQAHVHTYMYVCVCVFSCAYSTIVTDYLLSTCFGSHHLGTASSLGVELWRCTTRQCDMCDTCLTMKQRERGQQGGWMGSKSCVECVKNVILSHGERFGGNRTRRRVRGTALVRAAARLPKTSNGLLIN